MIREVPFYFLIFLLQIISSLLTFIGLPLLIPAIDFAQGLPEVDSEISQKIIYLFNYFEIPPTFGFILLVLTILFLSAEFTKLCSSILSQFIRLRISTDFRKKIISKYLKLKWLEINDIKSGKYSDSIIRQADLAAFSNLNAIRIIINAMQLITYVCLSIFISPFITLLAILVYGFISMGNVINHIGHGIQSIKFQQLSELLAELITDLTINNKYYKTTSFYNATFKPLRTLRDMFSSYLNLTIREEGQGYWVQALSFIFIVLVLFNYSALNISFSELILIVLIFQRLSPSFQAFQKSILDWKRDLPAYDSIKERIKNIDKSIELSGNLLLEPEINVKFENVSFSYNKNDIGLQGVTLNFEPYKTTAIIGESGSGKTTLIDLYVGLIRPSSGEILYNNIVHSDIDYEKFRLNIAFVGQGITLIDGTIKENLLLHEDIKEKFTPDDILESLKLVGLYDFVINKKEGLDFNVGENGSKLSGGQRQRLLIARGILRKTEIFILDEPTSNLDIDSQNEVYKAIESLHYKATIILITHSIKNARGLDFIYQIDKGKIFNIN